MASRSSGFSGIQLEIELMDAGKRLLLLSSSFSDVLDVLAHMERTLSKVQQVPSESMKYALHPIIDALIAKELVTHPDTNVNILVSCCISEILRIMAPNSPYNNQQMKDFFELATSTFEKLSSSSSGCDAKMTKVLQIFTTVRLPVIMLDLQLDKLVVRLFKQFLTVADFNSCEVIVEMEKIMTMIIEESEQPKIELVGLLVMSVRNYNQINSPVSWQLGEKVVKKCASKLKHQLPDFVQKMGIHLLDYSKVVSDICIGVPEGYDYKHEKKTDVNEKCKRIKVNHVIQKSEEDLLLFNDPPTPCKSQTKVKENCKKISTPSKKEGPEKTVSGKNLVGRRVKVWWPLDEMYYEGVVVSFDRSTGKHKINYNDGDEEFLNLKEEQWELVENVFPKKVWSLESCIICVQGYKVKKKFATILEYILTKHGDIASECVFKTASVRASFLEIICEVVTQLQTNSNNNNNSKTIVSKMEEIESKISEVEAANIRVTWLRSRFEVVKKLGFLMEIKASTSVAKKAAKMDLREIYEEFMVVKERYRKAIRCVKVLDLVEKKTANDILEMKTSFGQHPYLVKFF